MKLFLCLVLFLIPAVGQQQTGVQYADRFAGADICARIQAAIEALPNAGYNLAYGQYKGTPAKTGIIDATNFKGGIQRCAGGINIKQPIELRLGAYELRLKAPLDIRQSGTTVRGVGWEHNQYVDDQQRSARNYSPMLDGPYPRGFSVREPAYGSVIRADTGFVGPAVIRVGGHHGNGSNGNQGDDTSGTKIADLQVNCHGENINGININTVNTQADEPATEASAWAIFGTIEHISVYGCKAGINSKGPYAFDWTVAHSHLGHNTIGAHLEKLSNAWRFLGDEVVDNTEDGIYIDAREHLIGNVSIFGGDYEANHLNNIHLTCGGGQTDGIAIMGTYMETFDKNSRDIRFDDCSIAPRLLYRGVSITGNFMIGGGANVSLRSDYSVELPPRFHIYGFNYTANTCTNYGIACIHNPIEGEGGGIQNGTVMSNFIAGPMPITNNEYGMLVIDPYSMGNMINVGYALNFGKTVTGPTGNFTTGNIGNLVPGNIAPASGANLPIFLSDANRSLNLRHFDNAISGTNKNSPQFQEYGKFWNGSASVDDIWSWFVNVGSGINPASTLTFNHGGTSTGPTTIQMRAADTLLVNLLDAYSINTPEKGTCTLVAGTGACPVQNLNYPFQQRPICIGTWTGLGKLDGKIKMMETAGNYQVITPCSSDITDNAQINYICLGK